MHRSETTELMRCRFFFLPFFLRKDLWACVHKLPRTSITDIHRKWNKYDKGCFLHSKRASAWRDESRPSRRAGRWVCEGWRSVGFTKKNTTRRSMKKIWSQRHGTSCCCCFLVLPSVAPVKCVGNVPALKLCVGCLSEPEVLLLGVNTFQNPTSVMFRNQPKTRNSVRKSEWSQNSSFKGTQTQVEHFVEDVWTCCVKMFCFTWFDLVPQIIYLSLQVKVSIEVVSGASNTPPPPGFELSTRFTFEVDTKFHWCTSTKLIWKLSDYFIGVSARSLRNNQ